MRRIEVDIDAIGGVCFHADAREELLRFAADQAWLIGGQEVRAAPFLRSLQVIRNGASKIIKHATADTLEAKCLRVELVSDTLLEELRFLLDELPGYEQAFERWAEAEPAHRPRDPAFDHFVTEVMRLWQEAGGHGVGSYASAHSPGGYDGRLLALIRALLQAGKCARLPSDAKIHETILKMRESPYRGVTLKIK